MRQKKSSSPFLKVVILLLVLVVAGYFWTKSAYNQPITYPPQTKITIEKWDTIASFYAHQSGIEKFFTKLWLRNNSSLLPKLQEGTYLLSGSYQKAELLTLINKWPEKTYQRLTLLEGRSIYDIDQYLANKGVCSPGDFIAKASDQSYINELKNQFSFLAMIPAGKSLEGFLYPDTYFIDQNSDPLDQLIKAQLKNFNEKNWLPNQEELKNFSPAGINLQNYNALILASIIENEEKNAENKPTIAGIFINRLQKGMRLDADVSLCYGLKITYDKCRAAIVPNLNNRENLYNTRANTGLTPTPISSPTQATLWALLRYKKSDYLFYLHGSDGQIYYGATVEEHNQNKIHL